MAVAAGLRCSPPMYGVGSCPINYGANKMSNEDRLVESLAHYYRLSQSVLNEFGGPSIYFHVRAILEQERDFLSDHHIEMIYATLASWGMHRMGNPNVARTKMVEFSQFRNSIYAQKDLLYSLRHLEMHCCSHDEYLKHLNQLHKAYDSLSVSVSEATIVAHSKALAHILPNLVPPIDRQYTIRFFTQQENHFFTHTGNWRGVNLPTNRQEQFIRFKEYASRMKTLLDRCDITLFSLNQRTFNTSYPKIIDNLIMAYVKDAGRTRGMTQSLGAET